MCKAWRKDPSKCNQQNKYVSYIRKHDVLRPPPKQEAAISYCNLFTVQLRLALSRSCPTGNVRKQNTPHPAGDDTPESWILWNTKRQKYKLARSYVPNESERSGTHFRLHKKKKVALIWSSVVGSGGHNIAECGGNNGRKKWGMRIKKFVTLFVFFLVSVSGNR